MMDWVIAFIILFSTVTFGVQKCVKKKNLFLFLKKGKIKHDTVSPGM